MSISRSVGDVCGVVILIVAAALASATQVAAVELYLDTEQIDGTHGISTPWLFQPGDDLSWASPDFDDSQWVTRSIPERWPAGGYPESGQMAWYRLHLKVEVPPGPTQPVLGISIGKVMSAYEVYAGGEFIGRIGRVQPAPEMQFDRTQVYPIPHRAIAEDGTVVLALRVWGGDQEIVATWYGGPYRDEARIGGYDELVRRSLVAEIPQLIAVVLFVGFGLYHLYLFRRNHQLRLFLWFGLMALNIGVYSFAISQWKYLFELPFIVFQKLEFASIYLLPAMTVQMLWVALDKPIGRVLRLYQLSFVVFALAVALSPGMAVHYQTLNAFHLMAAAILVLAPWVLLSELRNNNREARTLLPGVTLFALACGTDILGHYTGWQSLSLIPFGFVAIALSMAVSLANNLTRMLDTLEDEVAKRTADLSEANMQLAEAARADPLTGLLNRRGFLEEVTAEVNRYARSGRSFSLILADVDHFKRFNDTYGHACGDYILRRVAGILCDRLRDVDRVARWGGEEFILMLPETDTQGAAVLADKLRKMIADSVFHFEGETITTTMTFGVATYRKDESLDNCIARADTAMYHGKKAGRNKVMLGGFKGLTLVN